MQTPTPDTFVFFTCQPGAEPALKQELAERHPTWRLAFSRPGFVSFKCPDTKPSSVSGPQPVFARTRSISLGRVAGESLSDMASRLWELEAVREFLASRPATGLHVWQRDTLLPGENNFEPGVTPLAEEVRRAIADAADQVLPIQTASVLPPDGVALDVVLVEPGQWCIGWHRAESRSERWPGGVLPVVGPEDMVSRAYLKMEEALKWSALPAERDDQWVELGCAPGGASQSLLSRGFRVLGVDPAEVDSAVGKHPNFRHLRKRAVEVRRSEFAQAKWLAADLSVTPTFTLDAVGDVVTHRGTSIRGLVLTLKLTDWAMATPAKLAEYVQCVQGWGYRDVRVRQLAHNRREVCLVALPSRAQRRVRRRRSSSNRGKGSGSDGSPPKLDNPATDSRPEVRFDAPLHSVPPHHFR